MAFLEPMHHNKPNITYLLTETTLINNKSALFPLMVQYWTGDKPLFEPVLTQFFDA